MDLDTIKSAMCESLIMETYNIPVLSLLGKTS